MDLSQLAADIQQACKIAGSYGPIQIPFMFFVSVVIIRQLPGWAKTRLISGSGTLKLVFLLVCIGASLWLVPLLSLKTMEIVLIVTGLLFLVLFILLFKPK